MYTILNTLIMLLFVSMATKMTSADESLLVFSKTEGFRHDSIEPGIEAIRELAAKHGLTVTATEDSEIFGPEQLAAFHAIVFLNTTLDVLNEEQQAALTEFVRGGGGYVGIHSAADTEYEWPWYGQLVGAYFDGHPSDPNVREGILHVVDSSHAATSCLPQPWVRTDEWYDYRYVNPNVHVLLLVDGDSYKRPEEEPSSEPHPIS
jgi:type 1 glutamine amidotransferase